MANIIDKIYALIVGFGKAIDRYEQTEMTAFTQISVKFADLAQKVAETSDPLEKEHLKVELQPVAKQWKTEFAKLNLGLDLFA